MRPLETKRRAITGGTAKSRSMGIDEMDLPKILAIVSDKLYNNPVAAVIREYSCNAWDAHVEAGIPDKPFDVGLPSAILPEFTVRDWGRGLSEFGIFCVFGMFGKSTKTHTNMQKGMFGIGAKAAYAYVTAFTIISYFGGRKTTYSAFIDEDKHRRIAELGVEVLGRYAAGFFEGLTNGSTPDPDKYVSVMGVATDTELRAAKAHALETYENLPEALLRELYQEYVDAAKERAEYHGTELTREDELEILADELRQSFVDILDLDPEEENVRQKMLEADPEDFEHWLIKGMLFPWLTKNAADIETGIEIRVPVQHHDIRRFTNEAKNIYRWFTPIPDIELNIEPVSEGVWLEKVNTRLFTSGYHGLGSRWIAEMGNVAYNIPMEQLQTDLEKLKETDPRATEILQFLGRAAGVIHVNIGELEPNPNRESLNITKASRQWLITRLYGVLEATTEHIEGELHNPDLTSWQRRGVLRKVLQDFGLSKHVVQGFHLDGHAELPTKDEDLPKTFTIKTLKRDWEHKTVGRKHRRRVDREVVTLGKAMSIPRWNAGVVLVIRDCDEPLKRLRSGAHSGSIIFLLDPLKEDYSYDEAELQAYLEKLQLDGLPTRKLSEYPIPAPERDPYQRKPHYSKTRFTWNGKNNRGMKSENWDCYPDKTLPDGAVYVVLDKFEPDVPNLKSQRRKHELMLSQLFDFGEDMPEIHGVKVSVVDKGKVNPNAIHYRTWLENQIAEGMKNAPKELRRLLKLRTWAGEDLDEMPKLPRGGRWDLLKKKLGAKHPIVQLFSRFIEAQAAWNAVPKAKRDALDQLFLQNGDTLHKMTARYSRALRKRIEDAKAQYPLLMREGSPLSLSQLGGSGDRIWVWRANHEGSYEDSNKYGKFPAVLQYIQDMDELRALRQEKNDA